MPVELRNIDRGSVCRHANAALRERLEHAALEPRQRIAHRRLGDDLGRTLPHLALHAQAVTKIHRPIDRPLLGRDHRDAAVHRHVEEGSDQECLGSGSRGADLQPKRPLLEHEAAGRSAVVGVELVLWPGRRPPGTCEDALLQFDRAHAANTALDQCRDQPSPQRFGPVLGAGDEVRVAASVDDEPALAQLEARAELVAVAEAMQHGGGAQQLHVAGRHEALVLTMAIAPRAVDLDRGNASTNPLALGLRNGGRHQRRAALRDRRRSTCPEHNRSHANVAAATHGGFLSQIPHRDATVRPARASTRYTQ